MGCFANDSKPYFANKFNYYPRDSMVDMRNSLTDKVAEKHNIILNLHRDVQRLEEQCRLASQHTQFKEEMIKELRKEIKALKGGACPQLTIQSKKASKILDATTVLHNCCPYVKDFCPMYLKTKVSSCMLSPINMENSKTTLNIQSPRAVRDVPAYDDDQTPTRDSLIEFSNPTIIELSRSRSFTHGEPVPRKQKTKLTATRVLHEYYGFKKDEEIYGNVETFSKIPKKINVVIPNHVPVKTFINNLEKNVVSNVEIENEKLKTEVSINELNHETH